MHPLRATTALIVRLMERQRISPLLFHRSAAQTRRVVCRDALTQGPPGLQFVAYGNASTSVTTGYGVAAPVPLVPCTALDNTTVCSPVLHPAFVMTSRTSWEDVGLYDLCCLSCCTLTQAKHTAGFSDVAPAQLLLSHV